MIGGCTDDGLTFLEWHDRGGVERILARVEKRYKRPLCQGEHRLLEQLDSELKLYFEGRLLRFETPIAVHGTAFEMRVWDQLLKIPSGQTRTYGELAVTLGRPGASRAVGRANGANYLGVVIPCHRVIASDGSLGGYGGKLWRKAKLLELEGARIDQSALAL
jgi:AraC family transcriptional regulator of adaptative response/methylated-DNA-[protein]-cysteine methyltransferase